MPPDFCEYGIKIVEDASDRESNDGVAETVQIIITLGIVLTLRLVNLAVDLDD